MVNTDQQRLQQVLHNLMSNAIKFSAKGKQITIHSHVVKSEHKKQEMEKYPAFKNSEAMNDNSDLLVVSVIDQGIGIREEDQQKLFKMFGFIDKTKDINTQGIGLGLNISKQIVKQFGGFI